MLKHNSQQNEEEAVELFPKVFLDSKIAEKMKLHRTKMGCVIS